MGRRKQQYSIYTDKSAADHLALLHQMVIIDAPSVAIRVYLYLHHRRRWTSWTEIEKGAHLSHGSVSRGLAWLRSDQRHWIAKRYAP